MPLSLTAKAVRLKAGRFFCIGDIMKTLIAALLLGFFVTSAHAADDWTIRTDAGDNGIVVAVDNDQIDVTSGTTFQDLDGQGPNVHIDAFGNTFGSHFAGQTQQCIVYPGGYTNGKIVGMPTSPLTILSSQGGYRSSNYQWGWLLKGDETIPYRYGHQSLNGGGCGFNGQRGNNGWAYKFAEPVNVVQINFGAGACRAFKIFEKIHFEVYAGITRIGHRDLTGTDQACNDITVTLASTIPMDGLTLWSQNNEILSVMSVLGGDLVGEPPPHEPPPVLTIEEQVEQNRVDIEELRSLHGIE